MSQTILVMIQTFCLSDTCLIWYVSDIWYDSDMWYAPIISLFTSWIKEKGETVCSLDSMIICHKIHKSVLT